MEGDLRNATEVGRRGSGPSSSQRLCGGEAESTAESTNHLDEATRRRRGDAARQEEEQEQQSRITVIHNRRRKRQTDKTAFSPHFTCQCSPLVTSQFRVPSPSPEPGPDPTRSLVRVYLPCIAYVSDGSCSMCITTARSPTFRDLYTVCGFPLLSASPHIARPLSMFPSEFVCVSSPIRIVSHTSLSSTFRFPLLDKHGSPQWT